MYCPINNLLRLEIFRTPSHALRVADVPFGLPQKMLRKRFARRAFHVFLRLPSPADFRLLAILGPASVRNPLRPIKYTKNTKKTSEEVAPFSDPPRLFKQRRQSRSEKAQMKPHGLAERPQRSVEYAHLCYPAFQTLPSGSQTRMFEPPVVE